MRSPQVVVDTVGVLLEVLELAAHGDVERGGGGDGEGEDWSEVKESEVEEEECED